MALQRSARQSLAKGSSAGVRMFRKRAAYGVLFGLCWSALGEGEQANRPTREVLDQEIKVEVLSPTEVRYELFTREQVLSEYLREHPEGISFSQQSDMSQFHAEVNILGPGGVSSRTVTMEEMSKGPLTDPSAPGVILGTLYFYQPPRSSSEMVLESKSSWLDTTPIAWMTDPVMFYASTRSPMQRVEIQVKAPANLQWASATQRGDWHVETKQEGEVQIYQCRLSPVVPPPYEPLQIPRQNLVAAAYVLPKKSWEELGREIYATYKPVLKRTHDLDELAHRIVGSLQGKAAAQALLEWVEENIRYVFVSLDTATGLVPPTAQETLLSRYGDCKAVSVLLSVLSEAVGIRCMPCLVSWGGILEEVPLPTVGIFNHEIAYFPDLGLFANPATSVAPLGVLDEGLYGQRYLGICKEGCTGVISAMQAADHTLSSDLSVTVQADGSLKAAGTTSATGRFATALSRILSDTGSPRQAVQFLFHPGVYGVNGTLAVTQPPLAQRPCEVQYSWEARAAADLEERALLLPDLGYLFSIGLVRGAMLSGARQTPALGVASVRDVHVRLRAPEGGVWQNLSALPQIAHPLVQVSVQVAGERERELLLGLHLELLKSRLSPEEMDQLGEALEPLQRFLLTPLRWKEA